MCADAPIGVFDSGVGGLSVLREIRRALPAEDVVYVADSAHAPYGEQTEEFIVERSAAIVGQFLARGVKLVVVACNTATGVAVDALRQCHALPIVAIEPAIKPAVRLTRSGVVGLLATRQTLACARVARLIGLHGQDVRILSQPCPGWVEQVERIELDAPRTRELVDIRVRPLVEQGVDVLVLGCTHYPFLSPLIRAVAGPDVTIVDPAEAVARQVVRRLKAEQLLRGGDAPGAELFLTSGEIGRVRPVIAALWGGNVDVRTLS